MARCQCQQLKDNRFLWKSTKKSISEDIKKERHFVYDLTAEGHSKAMVIDSDFKMTSRHELTFLEVDKEQQWWRFRLRELSNKLVKYDDATVAQIIEATNEISAII